MPWAILPTKDAVRDLEEIHDYVALHDSPQKAEYILSRRRAVALFWPSFAASFHRPRSNKAGLQT